MGYMGKHCDLEVITSATITTSTDFIIAVIVCLSTLLRMCLLLLLLLLLLTISLDLYLTRYSNFSSTSLTTSLIATYTTLYFQNASLILLYIYSTFDVFFLILLNS